MLSVIIPSYKDPLVHKTIDSLLENAVGDIEIIVVCDAYKSETPFIDDERVTVVQLGKNQGMRNAINTGVSIAKGEYLMRTDEHCIFAKGFDQVLTEACGPNQIMTARRFFLDPVKWEVMDLPPVEYERLVIQSMGDAKKFTGMPFPREGRDHIKVDETMAMQGSMWVMPRQWWKDVIVELQSEGYGTHLQDSHEMVFKTWKAGGQLMINKNTWFAHKHVSFPRTHQYGGPLAERSVKYCFDTWIDYYRELKKEEKWKNFLS